MKNATNNLLGVTSESTVGSEGATHDAALQKSVSGRAHSQCKGPEVSTMPVMF